MAKPKKNDVLYDDAVNAISRLFGDTSVSKSETKESLKSLIGEIETMIDSLGDE